MNGAPLRVAFLNWRDTTHPEGGGSERYVERVAADLAADGVEVTVHCSRYPGAARRECRDGVTYVRRGGRYGVYPRTLAALAAARLTGRAPDVAVDVQNGLPFLARLVLGARRVVVLVHHVHREQWGVVLGRAGAAVGWWVESWLSPRLHRSCQYVAVSCVTRDELVGLGVDAGRVAVVHNGGAVVPAHDEPVVVTGADLVVLGRLVPHKRVEHALETLARLRGDVEGLRLVVIGEGWWHGELTEHARRLGVEDAVVFTGFVDEDTKQAHLARARVLLAPSVKEGWGLMVVEAGAHGVPTVAYRDAGGLAESVVDGATGLLVDDLDGFVDATRRLLTDDALRLRLGAAARRRAAAFSWRTTSTSFRALLQRVAAGLPPVATVDPTAAVTVDLREHAGDRPAPSSRLQDSPPDELFPDVVGR